MPRAHCKDASSGASGTAPLMGRREETEDTGMPCFQQLDCKWGE